MLNISILRISYEKIENGIHSEDYLGYWLSYAQRSVAYAFSEALRHAVLSMISHMLSHLLNGVY